MPTPLTPVPYGTTRPAAGPPAMLAFLERLADVTVHRAGIGSYHQAPCTPAVLTAYDVLGDGSTWAVLDVAHTRLRWKLRNADHEGTWRGWSPR